MNNYHSFKNFDGDDCSSKGRCALSQVIVSLQELVLYFLRQASYYILKLEELHLYNFKLKNEIIDVIASLVYVSEYSEKQLYDLVMRCYYIYINSKSRYIDECNKIGQIPVLVSELFDFDESYTIPKSILIGDILIKNLYNSINFENRNYTQILFIVIKSLCQNISMLFDFGVEEEDSILKVIKCLSIWNDIKNDKLHLSDYINLFSIIDSNIQLLLVDVLFEKFGSISNVSLSHSTRRGKCILVSGSNFNELLNILEETQKLDIDVYTHSKLLISHSLHKFRQYPNLRGHYGRNTENCIVDYATFPGAILLTKNSKNNTEFLYRGKIFSNDYIAPFGVVKIENNNYKPLIDVALSSVGFKKGYQKPDTNLGFYDYDINNLISRVLLKLQTGKIKRLYILGISSLSEIQKEYFDVFFSHLRSDEFCISFSYESAKNNVETINIGNYFPLVTYILNKVLNNNKFLNKIYFLYPSCDISSVSSIIRLKKTGVNNLYISYCSPTVINPSVFGTFVNKYELNVFSDAISDLKNIRKNISQ